jgi:hypothetical protein
MKKQTSELKRLREERMNIEHRTSNIEFRMEKRQN